MRSPWTEFEVTGEQSGTTNTFISSFCQNNHCAICKDTLALNNKVRAISSYSAQLQSTSMPPFTHTASREEHGMLTKGKCFSPVCPLQTLMKCIMLQSVHYPSYSATPLSKVCFILNGDKPTNPCSSFVTAAKEKLQHKIPVTCDRYLMWHRDWGRCLKPLCHLPSLSPE